MHLLAFLLLFAADPGKPDVSGTWKLDASKCQLHSRIAPETVWTIKQEDEDIHLQSGEWQVTCGTRGVDCVVKDAAKPLKVSFWYNGPALVEMDTLGKNDAVTKKKMMLSPDGTVMTVEITHILPVGREPEKLVLTKQ